MKNSIIHPIVLLVLFNGILGCDENNETIEPIAFEANFHTVLSGFAEDASCEAPKSFLNTQEGDGTATLIGNFTTIITFCVDPMTLQYDNAEGSFVGSNGDIIYFEGSGQVLPSEREGYDLEFQDNFTITGGTGQFQGAVGELKSDSYVKNETQHTDHIWTGTILIME